MPMFGATKTTLRCNDERMPGADSRVFCRRGGAPARARGSMERGKSMEDLTRKKWDLSRNIWRHGDNNGIIIISLIWSLYGFIIVQWG
jgi:hypothetical protein